MIRIPTRLTNVAPGNWVAPEYSSIDAWSFGNVHLLLLARDHFVLYSHEGHFIIDLPIGASERPRWSRSLSGELTFLRGSEFVTYNVFTKSHDAHPFPEYVAIDDGGEADCSEDGDHRVLAGTLPDGSVEMFVYQISTGVKGPVLRHEGNWNNILVTPDNRLLLDGMYLFDDHMALDRQVFNTDSHKAVTRFNGRSVLLVSNSNENPVTLPDYPNGIVMVDLETGNQTGLLSLPWNLAVHISTPRNAGFCIVSTFDPTDSNKNNGFNNAILKVPLDGSAVEVLCYHGSDTSTYTGQPKATVSADGSRCVFGSNDGIADGPVNTYLINVGEGAQSEILETEPQPDIIITPQPAPELEPIPEPEPVRVKGKKKGWLARLFGWFW